MKVIVPPYVKATPTIHDLLNGERVTLCIHSDPPYLHGLYAAGSCDAIPGKVRIVEAIIIPAQKERP